MKAYTVNKGTPDSNGIHWWHRIQLPDGSYTPGIVNHGPDGGDWPTTRFGLPTDCTGLNIIDIGAWDGFFSFEAEKRGAEYVLATDAPVEQGGTWAGTDGFNFARKALDSKVEWFQFNVEKHPKKDNQLAYKGFDLVLCYGVMYHLKNPLAAVENLMYMVNKGGMVLVETAISINGEVPVLEYRPGFDGDPTNYFYPNTAWVEEAFKQNGAKLVEVIYNDTNRATFRIQA